MIRLSRRRPLRRWLDGQNHSDCCPVSLYRFDFDAAAVLVHDLFGARKADSGAFDERDDVPAPVEAVEDVRQVCLWDTNTLVPYHDAGSWRPVLRNGIY